MLTTTKKNKFQSCFVVGVVVVCVVVAIVLLFKIAFLIDIKWYLTVILISLMVICTLSMKKCLFFIDNEPLNQLSVIDEF